jgi:hypothetical protein
LPQAARKDSVVGADVGGGAKLPADNGETLEKILRDAPQKKIVSAGRLGGAAAPAHDKIGVEDSGDAAHGGMRLMADVMSGLARPETSL